MSAQTVAGQSREDSVCLLKYANIELLGRVFSFLWFDDHAAISNVSSTFRDAMRSENFLKLMLQRFLGQLNRPAGNLQLSTNARIDLLIRRVSSWPTSVDTAALGHPQGPRNVSIIPADIKAGDVCVVYNGGRKDTRHKAYAVAVTDDHFPCLPGTFTQPRFKNEVKMQGWVRPCKEAAHKAESQRSIARTMAPFTRLIQADELRQIATLSCIAYYECVFHLGGAAATPLNVDGVEDPAGSQQQLSIGLACALFPLRKRRPGFDNNSFGYHSDGRFYHGSRNFLQMGPTFKIGDIVGCGIIYPPLGKHCGKIFFTKNGGLVTMLDIGVGGLLGLPWFPVVGLAPGVPTQLNFGTRRPFAFDVLTFEAQQLGEALGSRAEAAAAASGGDPWNFYTTLALEQEAAQWAPRHPKYRRIDWEPTNPLANPSANPLADASSSSSSSSAGAAAAAAAAIPAPPAQISLATISSSSSSSSSSITAPTIAGIQTPPGGLATAVTTNITTTAISSSRSTSSRTSSLILLPIGMTSSLSTSSAGSTPSRRSGGFGGNSTTSSAVHTHDGIIGNGNGSSSSSSSIVVPSLNLKMGMSMPLGSLQHAPFAAAAGGGGGGGRSSSSTSSTGSRGSGTKETIEAKYALLAARTGSSGDDGNFIGYAGSSVPSPTPSSASGSHCSVKGSAAASMSGPGSGSLSQYHYYHGAGNGGGGGGGGTESTLPSRGKRPAPHDSSGSEHGGGGLYGGGRYGSATRGRGGRGFRAGSDYVTAFPGTPAAHILRDNTPIIPPPPPGSALAALVALQTPGGIMYSRTTGPASSRSGGSLAPPTPRQASFDNRDNDKEKSSLVPTTSFTMREKMKRRKRSLFLDPDLRAATLLEITNTSRVVFGGSDASWEGTGEEDSEEEEEDDEEELASTCGQGGGSQDEDWAYRAVRQISPRGVGGTGGVHPIAYPTLENDELSGLYRGPEAVTTLAGLGAAAGAAWSITPAEERERERNRNREQDEREGWCADSMAVECSSGEESAAAAGDGDGDGDGDDGEEMLKSSPTGSIDALPGHYHEAGSFTELYAEEEEDDEISDSQRLGGGNNSSNHGAELSMAEFMALSDVAATGGGWLQLQHVGGPAGVFLGVGPVGDGADGNNDSDDRSVATSLFVEVASVDECGSYVGYGGASESEEEEDEDEELDSRRGSRKNNLLGRPKGWGVDSASEREDKLSGGNGRHGGLGLLSLVGGYYPHQQPRYGWDPDGDGYDGASERGRCETDGVDDFGTDGDVGEEIDERDEQHGTTAETLTRSSTSGKDHSQHRGGGKKKRRQQSADRDSVNGASGGRGGGGGGGTSSDRRHHHGAAAAGAGANNDDGCSVSTEGQYPKLKIRRLSSPHASPLLSVSSSTTHGGSKANSVSSSRGGGGNGGPASRASPSLHSQDGDSVSGGGTGGHDNIPSRAPAPQYQGGRSHHGHTNTPGGGRDGGQTHTRYRHHHSYHRRRNLDAAALADDIGTAAPHHPSNPLLRDSSPVPGGAGQLSLSSNSTLQPAHQPFYPPPQFRG